MKKKYLLIITLAVLALINAAYLSKHAYDFQIKNTGSKSTFCDVSGSLSCSSVLESPYSKVFGVPFPWIALLVYPVLIVIGLIGLRTRKVVYAQVLATLSFLGVLFNGFIMYRELALIHAFCILCFMCSLIIITICITSLLIVRQQSKISA